MAYIAGGTLLLPACLNQEEKASVQLSNMNINGQQEQLVAELAETIIPQTGTPGAKAVGAPLFIWTMLNDCYTKEDQQKFLSGLSAFNKEYSDKNDQSFIKSGMAERVAFLQQADARKEKKDDLHFFLGNAKKLTVQAYTSSKYFLTEVQPYELIPGRYHGCVPVQKNTRKKA